MNWKNLIFRIFSDSSQPSSKRIAGFLGFIVCLTLTSLEVINGGNTPTSLEIGYYTSASLLGLDAITSIFKNKNNERNNV